MSKLWWLADLENEVLQGFGVIYEEIAGLRPAQLKRAREEMVRSTCLEKAPKAESAAIWKGLVRWDS